MSSLVRERLRLVSGAVAVGGWSGCGWWMERLRLVSGAEPNSG